MFFKETAVSRIDDFDLNGKMTPVGILKNMETVSDRHSTQVYHSAVETSLTGITWFLSEWRIAFRKAPSYRDKVSISTWIVKEKITASRVCRDFLMTDENGEELVRAEGKCAMFDLKNGRIVRISDDFRTYYDPEELDMFPQPLPKRVSMPENCFACADITIRKADVDYNGHVHNTVYLDYAQEVLPKEVFMTEHIAEIHITYRKPILYGSKVTLRAGEENGVIKVGLYCEEELASIIEITPK